MILCQRSSQHVIYFMEWIIHLEWVLKHRLHISTEQHSLIFSQLFELFPIVYHLSFARRYESQQQFSQSSFAASTFSRDTRNCRRAVLYLQTEVFQSHGLILF